MATSSNRKARYSELRKAAVIGASDMGAALAAHLANGGFEVWLYDGVPSHLTEQEQLQGLTLQSPEVRNRLSASAIAALSKQQPPPLYDRSFSRRIHACNTEDDACQLHEMDWIIEAVEERLELKQQTLSWIDRNRREGSLVSSQTSSLSAATMIRHCSKEMRQHFAITHFFNPPRYVMLVELSTSEETLPQAVETLTALCQTRLGKSVISVKDQPHFIVNRLLVISTLATIKATLHYRLTIEEADALTGTAMGRNERATFRTADHIGLDRLLKMSDQLSTSSSDAARIPSLPLLVQLVRQGLLGNKSGAGFYRNAIRADQRQQLEMLQLSSLTYAPCTDEGISSPVIEAVKQAKGTQNKVRALIYAAPDHPHAQFAWQSIKALLLHATEQIHHIANHPADIDRAMRLGLGWELGPFELWEALGLTAVAERMKQEGEQLPDWIENWIHEGHNSFDKCRQESLQPSNREEHNEDHALTLASIKAEKGTVWHNRDASLIDLGDDVLALEFHSHSNTIGSDVLSAIRYACYETMKNWRGLVIANEGPNFCIGTDWKMLLTEAMHEDWNELEDMIISFQQSMKQLKALPLPVVAAPHRMTLGSGAALCMAADALIIAPETYFGFVEASVGLIPAGGGSKEAALLAMKRAAYGAGLSDSSEPKLLAGDLLPQLTTLFDSMLHAKTSTSGFEIARLGYDRPQDRVLLRGDTRIYEAKQEVLRLGAIGYAAPAEELVAVAGREGKASLKLMVQALRLGGYISEHDEKIAYKLIHVLCGGDVASGALVSEHYLLQLECEAFLSLCGEPKTQQRIRYMLQHGKPLYN